MRHTQAYGYNGGVFHTPVSGCTVREGGDFTGSGGKALRMSAYRFHDEDPLLFRDGVRMTWRVGDYMNRGAHPESPKCLIETPGPDDWPVGEVQDTTVTSYAWVYEW